MELLFESRLDIKWKSGKVNVVQGRGEIMPQPVLTGDSFIDGGGVSIYGSVLRDGGRFRMWYQAYPKDWDGQSNSAWVCYAESDDGLNWNKPALNIVEYGGGPNNLCNLGVHSPSVFIDPEAPPSHRYRATGCVDPGKPVNHPGLKRAGYYTFHSADGLYWEADSLEPAWDSVDVITSVYHPRQGRGIVAMKFNPMVRGFMRRVIYNAELRDGRWSPAHPALIPDEFDDVCAIARGYSTGDYYGMAMLPAGSGTAGMIWQFRHRLPRPPSPGSGQFGSTDITLAYQAMPEGCWEHQAGRPDFISCASREWTRGGVYSASCPVDVGDEHWLYVTGSSHSHAWSYDEKGEKIEKASRQRAEQGHSKIGLARWPKWRLFGFQADPEGGLTFETHAPDGPSDLYLNYACEPDGHIDINLTDNTGAELLDTAQRLTGDAVEGKVTWEKNALHGPAVGRPLWVHLNLNQAGVYAYELRPA